MTDLDDAIADAPAITDGRVARRHRNINAVIDVVLEMFSEESMFPTMEQVATRSGLSLRSLYRYFADPAELLEAVITRRREQYIEWSHLPSIGQGPFDKRIDAFVAMRMTLYERAGATYRATIANASRHPRVQRELTRNRGEMRVQLERQFAPELAEMPNDLRRAALGAADVATQLDAIDYLQRHCGLNSEHTSSVLATALQRLLG